MAPTYQRTFARINFDKRRVDFYGEDTAGEETLICCVQQPGWLTCVPMAFEMGAWAVLRNQYEGEVREAVG